MNPGGSPTPQQQPAVQVPVVGSRSPEPSAAAEPIRSDSPSDSIQWQASEFVDHQKNPIWFLLFGLGTVVFSIGIYFITGGSILSTVVVAVAGLTFAMYAGQKPRTLTYALLPNTLKIGDKQYSYDDFKTFSVMQEGALNSIILQPLKRFLPPLTLYFANDDGEKIFDILASRVPHEERKADAIDSLMRRIRF